MACTDAEPDCTISLTLPDCTISVTLPDCTLTMTLPDADDVCLETYLCAILTESGDWITDESSNILCPDS